MISAAGTKAEARSSLAASGGFLLTRILSSEFAAELVAESQRQEETIREQRRDADGADGDAGDPDRWLDAADGVPALAGLFGHPEIQQILRDWTGHDWVPTGQQAAYSYYRRRGHYLGLHRDIATCDLALITCLRDNNRSIRRESGMLRLYPNRSYETVCSILRSPERDSIMLALQPGESLILYGRTIPHQLLPMGRGHVRVVAPLCFRAFKS